MSQSNSCIDKINNQTDCQELDQDKIRIAISLVPIIKKKDWNRFTKNYIIETISYYQLAEYLKVGRAIGFDFTLTKDEKKLLIEKKKIKQDCNYYRDGDYFKRSEFIAIEFDDNVDNKFTLKEIREGKTTRAKYVNENACIVYTSPSHRTEGKVDRFHVIFQLPREIQQRDELKNIHKALQSKFPASDQSDSLSGAYWGCGINAETMILGNRLSDNALEELLNAHKPDTQFKDNISGTKITPQYAKAVYRGELSEFPQEASKDKHNRNTVLYKISRRIGEMLPYLDYFYNEVFLEIVRVAESIGTDKSYTSKDIRKTIENGLNKGLKNPIQSHTSIEYKGYGYDTDTTDSNVFFKPYRQFATKDYNNAIQFPKGNMNTLKNEILSLMVIDDEKKVDHIKELYAIKGETNDQNVQVFYILKSLESWDLHKYYMGYWVYSNEVKAIDNEFYDLRLNDVLECMYNGNFKDINSKYERYKLFDVTNALAFMQTRIVENNTMKVVKQYLDYEARIKNNGKIDKTKLKKLILFNRTSNIMGCYSPKTIFRLSGNDFGLAFYLTENINRNCLCRERRKNGEKYYLPPTLSKTPLKWDSEYACQCAGLSGTFNINESKAISDLENRFDTLKDYAIVNRWEYRKDENKYHIYICNPFA